MCAVSLVKLFTFRSHIACLEYSISKNILTFNIFLYNKRTVYDRERKDCITYVCDSKWPLDIYDQAHFKRKYVFSNSQCRDFVSLVTRFGLQTSAECQVYTFTSYIAYNIPIQYKCFAVECNMILYFHWVLIRLNVQQNGNNTTINKKKKKKEYGQLFCFRINKD